MPVVVWILEAPDFFLPLEERFPVGLAAAYQRALVLHAAAGEGGDHPVGVSPDVERAVVAPIGVGDVHPVLVVDMDADHTAHGAKRAVLGGDQPVVFCRLAKRLAKREE